MADLDSMCFISPARRSWVIPIGKVIYARKSIIITSQLSLAKLYEYINEPTLADVILDRLIANAHPVELKRKSLRKNKQDPSR